MASTQAGYISTGFTVSASGSRVESSCPDLGQSCYSQGCRLSATCVCARPPSQQPASLLSAQFVPKSPLEETESLVRPE